MASEKTKIKTKNEFNPEEFRVKFRAFLSTLAFAASIVFLFVMVLNGTASSSKYGEYIIGWMTGTLITLIFTFYFGSSDGSNLKMPLPQDPEPSLQSAQSAQSVLPATQSPKLSNKVPKDLEEPSGQTPSEPPMVSPYNQ